jgi:DNA-directed RNA polymerase subunit K/omega
MPFRQVYEIEAASDDDAASQGLKRFELDVLAALRARN